MATNAIMARSSYHSIFRAADDEAQRPAEALLLAPMPILRIPRARVEIVFQGCGKSRLHLIRDKSPGGLRAANGRVEETFGPCVKSFREAVHAVFRDRDDSNLRSAESRAEGTEGRHAPALGGDEFGNVIGQPETIQSVPIKGQYED